MKAYTRHFSPFDETALIYLLVIRAVIFLNLLHALSIPSSLKIVSASTYIYYSHFHNEQVEASAQFA